MYPVANLLAVLSFPSLLLEGRGGEGKLQTFSFIFRCSEKSEGVFCTTWSGNKALSQATISSNRSGGGGKWTKISLKARMATIKDKSRFH